MKFCILRHLEKDLCVHSKGAISPVIFDRALSGRHSNIKCDVASQFGGRFMMMFIIAGCNSRKKMSAFAFGAHLTT